jgi:hypothetical protein
MKITAFCVLAEPDKLMYPYIESIRSVTHFADKVIINYAAAKEDKPQLRQFEKASYEKLLSLKNEVKERCDIQITLDENWKSQKDQTYEEIRGIFQRALDSCKSGWFLKFDADNVFRKNKTKDIKSLFDKETDKLIFRRLNFGSINYVGTNNSSEDIYAINVSNLTSKNVEYKIGDVKNWCRACVLGDHKTRIISDKELIPVNYDATFFTKERTVDFWKKTEEAYSFVEKRPNKMSHLTDEQIIHHYKSYKKVKNGNLQFQPNFEHPEDMQEKMSQLNKDHWGFKNFEE